MEKAETAFSPNNTNQLLHGLVQWLTVGVACVAPLQLRPKRDRQTVEIERKRRFLGGLFVPVIRVSD